MHPSGGESTWRTSRSRRTWLGLLALAAVTMLAAAGCGHSAAATPAAKTAKSSPSAGPPALHVVARCGTSRTVANVPVRIEVTRGKVACTEALTIEHDYTRDIAEGKAPGNGGGGPVMVNGWKCQGYPTEKVLATGWASRCVRAGTQILAVLPPPKKS
jgi:hypothetical protein